MFRFVLKWFLKVFTVVLVLVILVLVGFRITSLIRENKQPHDAAPKNGYFVSGGDIQIYVQETGPKNGVPVVLVHGFGAWSGTWAKTLEALAKENFHAYALDLPPFGFSEKVTNGDFSRSTQAKRIITVLDNLKLDKVILVGHSIGGRPTVETALTNSSRIKKLVLVDAALGFDAQGLFEQNQPSALLKLFFGIKPLRNAVLSTTATNPMFSRKLLSGFVADKNVLTKDLVGLYQQPFIVKGSTQGLGDWLKTVFLDSDNSESTKLSNFSQLTMPTLLIWGAKDTITPPTQGQQLEKSIPHATLAVLPDVGHIPQIENPEAFNKTLLEFLKK